MSNEQFPKLKAYLGDSVYVQFDGYHIVLTTENGYPDDPRNKICLDPSVFASLFEWKQRLDERIASHNSKEPAHE